MDPTSPASTWPLDPSGFAEIDSLLAAGVLPANEAVWFSSTEPKAVQTAARLTSSRVPALDELREADRPADWLDAETFAAAVATSLERPAEVVRDGWETSDSVRARVFGALRGAVARHAASEGAVDVGPRGPRHRLDRPGRCPHAHPCGRRCLAGVAHA